MTQFKLNSDYTEFEMRVKVAAFAECHTEAVERRIAVV